MVWNVGAVGRSTGSGRSCGFPPWCAFCCLSSILQEPSESSSIQRFISLASYALVIGVLWVGQTVIIPIVFAALLAFLLSPAVRRLNRWRVPNVLAITLVVLAGFGVVGGLGWMVGHQVLNLAEELPAYERTIRQKISKFNSPGTPAALERTSEMIKQIQKDLKDGVPTTVPGGKVGGEGSKPAEPEPVRVRVEEEVESSFDLLGRYAGPILGPLLQAGIIIVLFVAMLIGRDDLRDRFIKVVSAGRINLATQALDDAARRVMRYLLMQLVVNAVYGVPVGIGLYFIGVPNALLWGLLATLLRYIPFLGPWIAASFPVMLAVAVDPGWSMLVYTVALFLVMELVSNNILEVWLYGAGTGISNLALLVAAVFWTSLWGPVGLVLSTPLTVCLLVLGRNVPGLWFLSTLLGSEPVLDPPTQFYQRMLSMDADEMMSLATDFIGERSLAAFYDEMFLPALLMAEEDRHTGSLAEVRQRFIFRASRELIEELERRGEEKEEKGEESEKPRTVGEPAGPLVWGVPAGDDADELVGLMLSHLLRERGLRAAVSRVEASIEEQSERLLREKPAAAFVSALPPSALSPALRAFRRLKHASPKLPVVVGIWTRTSTPGELQGRLRDPKPDAIVTHLAAAVVEIERLARLRAGLKESPGSTLQPVPAPAPQPADDRRLGLKGMEPEAWIERVTRALAQVFDVPVSLVSVVDTDDGFWSPRLGLKTEPGEERDPLLRGFLRELAAEEDLLDVDDAKKDRRTSQNVFVTERGVRLFIGLVLRTSAGQAVGHVCIVDTKPHETTDEQRSLVRLYGLELVEAVEELTRSTSTRV